MARSSLPIIVVVAFVLLLVVYNTFSTTGAYHHHGISPNSGFFARRFFFLDSIFRTRRVRTEEEKKRLFHVALTANGSPYHRWQCRIMYYWYKQFKDRSDSDMGGFTRILHSGKPDNLMDEIPTVVVDPLPAGMDRGYAVLNRPWAFMQWLRKAKIKEDYIMMAEPDYIFVKPLPNLAFGKENPAAFPYFYIKPREHEEVIRKFYPPKKGPVTDIYPIGNSPVIIRKAQLKKIAPRWMNISLQMMDYEGADDAFGWLLEMYGYAIASARNGVKYDMRSDFLAQVTLVEMVNEATANIGVWKEGE